MANATIGTKAVGSIVKIKVNGVLTDFIIAHQGLPGAMYDSSCDGTWVLMKDCYAQRAWNTTNYNNYSSSDINAYLNGAWLNLVETNVKNQVKKIKIPWSDPESSYQIYSGANGLSCRVFLLAAYEVGITVVNSSTTPFIDGAKLGGLLLAAYCIHNGYVGSLPWLSAMVGLPWTAHGVVCSFYLNMAKSDHREGGITFESAKANSFTTDENNTDGPMG